jgi:hypothetical protein
MQALSQPSFDTSRNGTREICRVTLGDSTIRRLQMGFQNGRRENRHNLDVRGNALRADKSPMLGHLGVDHIVPELQLLEGLHRLMIAAEAEAMDGQRRLATRSGVANGLCRLTTPHARKIAAAERFVSRLSASYIARLRTMRWEVSCRVNCGFC